ncbi:MAG: CCA tRNA nucleotidyltransferase, partial [Pseudomonadota bacterium]
TGYEHGTITAIADHRPYEITTLRKDVETDGRRAVVAFTEDWAEDAGRRDFRLNALYADPDGTVHDPVGGGLEDAASGRVIFIGDADERLREDYLRILRFYRFNAWYGAGIDPEGQAACARQREGLAKIAAERTWKEFEKLLRAPDPTAALAAMEEGRVLAQILPGASAARFGAFLEVVDTPWDPL